MADQQLTPSTYMKSGRFHGMTVDLSTWNVGGIWTMDKESLKPSLTKAH